MIVGVVLLANVFLLLTLLFHLVILLLQRDQVAGGTLAMTFEIVPVVRFVELEIVLLELVP